MAMKAMVRGLKGKNRVGRTTWGLGKLEAVIKTATQEQRNIYYGKKREISWVHNSRSLKIVSTIAQSGCFKDCMNLELCSSCSST